MQDCDDELKQVAAREQLAVEQVLADADSGREDWLMGVSKASPAGYASSITSKHLFM